jgi:hypothetical protein
MPTIVHDRAPPQPYPTRGHFSPDVIVRDTRQDAAASKAAPLEPVEIAAAPTAPTPTSAASSASRTPSGAPPPQVAASATPPPTPPGDGEPEKGGPRGASCSVVKDKALAATTLRFRQPGDGGGGSDRGELHQIPWADLSATRVRDEIAELPAPAVVDFATAHDAAVFLLGAAWANQVADGDIDRHVVIRPSRQPVSGFADAIRAVSQTTTWHGPLHVDAVRALNDARRLAGADESMRKQIDAAVELAKSLRADLEVFARALRQGTIQEVERATLALQTKYPQRWCRRQIDKVIAEANRAEATKVRDEGPCVMRAPAYTGGWRGLQPAETWEVLIDETELSRRLDVCAVVVPGGSLPPLDMAWHATERPAQEVDGVLQRVVDHPIGMLALATDATSDGWMGAVQELVAWAVRLIPMKGKTRVHVVVENRGASPGNNWRAAAARVWSELHAADPARANQLVIDIELTGKGEHATLPYADVVAFAWGAVCRGRDRGLSREAFARMTSWFGKVPLDDRASLAARRAWDAVSRDEIVDWRNVGTIVHAAQSHLLDAFTTHVAGSRRPQFDALLQRINEHLDSKSVHLPRLGAEIALARAVAPERALSARQAWVWALLRLQQQNHQGGTDAALLEHIKVEGTRMLEEDAPLVCLGDLYRAVFHSNRFEFEAAAAAVADWRDIPIPTPGLRMHARVLSALGQYRAFQGDHVGAVALFDRAIEEFGGLSDARMAAGEIQQTSTYRLIARMDAGLLTPGELSASVGPLNGSRFVTLARQSADALNADRYLLAVLVRWLFEHGSAEQRRAFLPTMRSLDKHIGWTEGHPWPVIGAYTALLMDREPQSHADLGWRWRQMWAAFDDPTCGPTVRFILLVCGAVGQAMGHPIEADIAGRADELRPQLPMAPWKAYDAIPQGPGHTERADAIAQLRACLPFNFR